MNCKLTDTELSMVCEVIATHTGLHFPVEKWEMLSRSLALAAREFGFNDLNRFIHWLLSTNLGLKQIGILASYVTISETYFWRESNVFEAFSQDIIRSLVETRNIDEKNINVWCAGCSTGEEAYSIAILLYRNIPEKRDWKITIIATDINLKALSVARSGIYGSWSFRNSPSWLRSTYFKKLDNEEYEVIPEIKKMVTFSYFNLVEDNFKLPLPGNIKPDIIFCRNVLMYFTCEWANKVSSKLIHSLSENGWLVVSSCELSLYTFPELTTLNFPGAIIYQNIANEKLEPMNSMLTSSHERFLDSNNEAKIAANVTHQPNSTTSGIVKSPGESISEKIFEIRQYADQGHLEEALSICCKVIAKNKLIPELYLLRASILQELEKSQEAIKSLRQAIFINPDYLMGHFTLGNLFFKQGEIKKAKRHFMNAIELIDTMPNSDSPVESEGLSVDFIRGSILSNLRLKMSV